MKKILSILMTFIFMTICFCTYVSADTTVSEIVICDLKAPVVKTDPDDYQWSIPANVGYYINGTYYGVKSSLYYMNGEDLKEAVDFTESDEYCYFLIGTMKTGYNIDAGATVKVKDSDAHIKATIVTKAEQGMFKVEVWYKVTSPNAPTVTFDGNGGLFGGNQTNAIKTDKDGFLTDTPQIPLKEGYAFGGWYEDRACTTKIHTDTHKFLQSTTVYAGWKEATGEVRIDNVVLPMPGRKPVFSSYNPNDYMYAIEWEMWENVNTGAQIYSSEKLNNTLSDSQKLTSFVAGNWYTYKVKVSTPEDYPLSSDAVLCINAEEKSTTISGDVLSADFQAVEPGSFLSYDECTIRIPAGVHGEDISFSIKDYVGGIDFSGDADFTVNGVPEWVNVNKSDWSLSGTRDSASPGSHSLEITITSGSDTSVLYLVILKTEEKPFITEHPESVSIPCGGEGLLRVKVAGGASATYKWRMEYGGYWFDVSAWASSFDMTGYDTDTLKVGSANIPEAINFKCEITVGSDTLTSIEATVTVEHSYDSTQIQIESGVENEDVHSCHCSLCDKNFEVKHSKMWLHSYYPGEGETVGQKYWKCCECGMEGAEENYDTSVQSQGTCYFNPNYENRIKTGKVVYINSYDDFDEMIPKREGYIFTGWALTKDAKVPDYVRGQKILIGEDAMEFYAVWAQPSLMVGGKVVTIENKDNITGDEDAYYDSETATLTLDNAIISASEITTLMNNCGIYARGYLEIKLIGNNYIGIHLSKSYGIEVDGVLKISGDGKLEISSEIDLSFVNAIKADKVYFEDGFIYLKDCKTAVGGDAFFNGGICETYVGDYIPSAEALHCAYAGEIDTNLEKAYYASHAYTIYNTAEQTSPYTLNKDAEYTIVAPLKSGIYLHYNSDRDSVINLHSFDCNMDVFIAGHATKDSIIDMKVKRDVPMFTEINTGYTTNSDLSAVKIYVWEAGTMHSIIEPEIIGKLE